MITIRVSYTKDGLVQQCVVKGHAEYDDPGYDIVCAAVSVLTCTAILGLEQVAKQAGTFTNESGKCEMSLSGELTQSGQDIIRTMLLGLEEISRQYSDFVKFSDK